MLEIQSQVHQNLMKNAISQHAVAIIVRMFTYVLNEDTI